MKSKIFSWIFLSFLLNNNKVIGQIINGRVIDSKTLNAACYSTLEIKGKGIGWVTDSLGSFSIEIIKDKISEYDTLLIRSLGYSSATVIVKNILTESSIEFKLNPLVFQLDSIIIRPKNNSILKGVFVEKGDGYSGCREWLQKAVYMDNDEGIKAIVQNVSFFIPKDGKPKTPFRIRFYEVKEDGSPGEDLTRESIIVNAKKGGAWLKVDVSKYKIVVPKNGYFVAMEWIFTDKKYYYEILISDKKYVSYGQCLGRISNEGIIPNSWTYELGNRWRKIDKTSKIQGKMIHYNQLINSEIKPIE